MIHNFETEVAKEVGILGATIYTNILYWSIKNKANERHYYDGKYWVYNSVKGWCKLLDYATESQVRLALNKLKEAGFIDVGKYNKLAYDHTKWYCVKRHYELSEKTNQSVKNDKPIPINKPINKPISKHTPKIQEWIDYRKEIKKPITSIAIKKLEEEYKLNPKQLTDKINNSIMQGYQGLFENKDKPKEEDWSKYAR